MWNPVFKLKLESHISRFDKPDLSHYLVEDDREDRREYDADQHKSDPEERVLFCRIGDDAQRADQTAGSHTCRNARTFKLE